MAKDLIHDAVKRALERDGWHIFADPFRIEYAEFVLLADLAAERPFAVQKGDRRIVVEIKTFVGRSFVKELQQALGQYAMYRDFIELTTPEFEIYLAIGDTIYAEYFAQQAAQVVIQRHQVKLLIVNIDTEEVVQWID